MKKKKQPKPSPIGIGLAELKLTAIAENLPATAYLVDLASFCLGWELANGSFGARMKVKTRIKKDMELRNKL